MAGKTKHVAAVLLRIVIIALVSICAVTSGILMLLREAWCAGIALVLFGALLLAIPVSLLLTQRLCTKLYGIDTRTPQARDLANDAHEQTGHTNACPLCAALRAWSLALVQGVYLPAWEILSMRTRGTPPDIVVSAYVMIRKSGDTTSLAELEDIYIGEHFRIHDAFDLVHIVQGIID